MEEEEQKQESWHAKLDSEDLKSNESLAKFKNVESLAGSYLEMEKSFNKRVAVPGEEASEEVKERFYNRLGRPSDKKYVVDERKKEDEEIIRGFEEVFYNSGLSKKQGEAVLKKMYEQEEKHRTEYEAELKKIGEDNRKSLKESYGKDFDSNIRKAESALKKYGNKDLENLLKEAQYNPIIVDFLVKVGKSEAAPLITSKNSQDIPLERESALKEIIKLESDDSFMLNYRNKNRAGHKEANERMRTLMEAIHGS
ncbi:MAG: hypothetical protein GY858_01155 [Candidatus Omnitrophica bacterium]|nr:hypothetical protein [Candidatus Omnitrophota bacterium]